MLESIKLTLGVGKIAKSGKKLIQYRVSSVEDLSATVTHFDKYPLLTQKRADFELLKRALEIMNRKEHLTSEGLQKIVNIKASMNKGLSAKLKSAFPNTKPVPCQGTDLSGFTNPQWLSGFT